MPSLVQDRIQSTVVIDFNHLLDAYKPFCLRCLELSQKGDVQEAMRNIYSVLRQAEKVEGAKLILLPDLTGMDDEFAPSVMDRIVRATSGRLIEIPAHPVFSSVSYKQATPPRCRLASHRTYSTRRRTPACSAHAHRTSLSESASLRTRCSTCPRLRSSARCPRRCSSDPPFCQWHTLSSMSTLECGSCSSSRSPGGTPKCATESSA